MQQTNQKRWQLATRMAKVRNKKMQMQISIRTNKQTNNMRNIGKLQPAWTR